MLIFADKYNHTNTLARPCQAVVKLDIPLVTVWSQSGHLAPVERTRWGGVLGALILYVCGSVKIENLGCTMLDAQRLNAPEHTPPSEVIKSAKVKE